MKKKLFFVHILGGEKLLKSVESAGVIFLSGLRGLKIFQTRFGSFFGSFFAFSNRFSDRFKFFSGAVSFCRHAAPMKKLLRTLLRSVLLHDPRGVYLIFVTFCTDMITNVNLKIFIRFRFRNGEANEIPQVFFCICFRNGHVGTTTGHAYRRKVTSPRISFAFAFAFVIQ